MIILKRQRRSCLRAFFCMTVNTSPDRPPALALRAACVARGVFGGRTLGRCCNVMTDSAAASAEPVAQCALRIIRLPMTRRPSAVCRAAGAVSRVCRVLRSVTETASCMMRCDHHQLNPDKTELLRRSAC
jgi:hypothetical protein